MLNEAFGLVKEFQSAAGQPVSQLPVELGQERLALRVKWMAEELEEFQQARNLLTQADALTDLLYYLLGIYVEMGIKPDGLFQIIHRSNMMKLNASEGIVKDLDGKVEKPAGWMHPDRLILEELEHLKTENSGTEL